MSEKVEVVNHIDVIMLAIVVNLGRLILS